VVASNGRQAGRRLHTNSERPTRRNALEQAYQEAVRTAARSSLLGALGFGLALLMAAVLAGRGTLLGAGWGLETLLLFGGIAGGLLYTTLAMRASRHAKEYRRRLDGGRSPPSGAG
jgi:hypothetical protein